MSDEEWRQAERAWLRSKDDAELARRAIIARRRAGVPVPGELLERQQLVPTSFTSKKRFRVFVESLEGEILEVGATPGTVPVPECREWWVRPQPAKVTPWLVGELGSVPGLSMERAKLTPEGVAEIARLEHLNWLSLETCTNLDDETLRPLAALRRLDTLDLSGVKGLRAKGLALLAGMPGLVRLRVARVKELKDVDLAPLAKLSQLALLSLLMTGVTDAGLRHVSALRELTHLDLSYDKKVTDKGVAALSTLSKLRHLSLASCEKVSTLAPLAGLPLESLNLHMCRRLTPEALSVLARAPLRKLDLSSNEDGALIPAVARIMPGLRELDVFGTRAVDDELASLAALRGLRVLRAHNVANIGLRTLEAFAAHPSLEVLELFFCPHLGDDAARAIARISGLRRLRLSFSRITDAGLAALATLPSLEHLEVEHVNTITEAGVVALQAARPGCVVSW